MVRAMLELVASMRCAGLVGKNMFWVILLVLMVMVLGLYLVLVKVDACWWLIRVFLTGLDFLEIKAAMLCVLTFCKKIALISSPTALKLWERKRLAQWLRWRMKRSGCVTRPKNPRSKKVLPVAEGSSGEVKVCVRSKGGHCAVCVLEHCCAKDFKIAHDCICVHVVGDSL